MENIEEKVALKNKGETLINEKTLDLIREWIRAEIDAKIADNEEDSSGYRGNGYFESRMADALFIKLKNLLK